MKLEPQELKIVIDCVANATIKGSDAQIISALLMKLAAGYEEMMAEAKVDPKAKK